MEKLTLKELAPYLPYNLMMLNLHTNMPYQLTGRVIEFIADLNKSHKPILRPLSDLTKEIEHDGEKFVPQSKLSHLDLEWLITSENLIMKTNYEDVLQLLELHFDIFGLLDKNLAVPVTEEFNPYK